MPSPIAEVRHRTSNVIRNESYYVLKHKNEVGAKKFWILWREELWVWNTWKFQWGKGPTRHTYFEVIEVEGSKYRITAKVFLKGDISDYYTIG